VTIFEAKSKLHQLQCWTEARSVAQQIAVNSPVAVVGTKVSLNYSRDHSTQEGLDHIRLWNATMLQSDDLKAAVMAQLSKKPAVYAKL
jgi:enoyl-CoA hydratase/carnithine racemase